MIEAVGIGRGGRARHRALEAAEQVLAEAAGGADFVRRTVYLVSFGVIGAFLATGAAVPPSAPGQAPARRRAEEIAAATSAGE